MSAIDYSRLLDHLEHGSDAFVSHNAATAIAIHGGTEVALSAPVHFDPRDDHRFRLERRVLIAFLAEHWARWPEATSEQAFMSVVLAIAQHVDAARTSGAVRLDDEGGGDLPGLLAHLETLPPLPGWTLLQKRRLKDQTLAQALKAFVGRILERQADTDFQRGIGAFEPSIQITMRWYPFVGASTAAMVEQRERFFVAYAHALMTTNAYKMAGAQYFGPVIGNTPTTTFLEALTAWRAGTSLADAPLIALDSTLRPAADRAHTNLVRELWGFLNLHRVPIYNSRVAEYASYAGTADPSAITASIGAQTQAWLAANPAQVGRAAALFPRLLEGATRENGKAFAYSRHPINDDDTTSFDARLNAHIRDAGKRRLLLLDERARAAVVLHLALDAEVYRESLRTDAATTTASASTAALDVAAARVWIYAPGRQAMHWSVDHADKTASLQSSAADLSGVASLGDVDVDDADFSVRTCWQLAHDVQIGDRIVARRGRSTIVGIGVVDGPYRYVADRAFAHTVGVRWQWSGEHALHDPKSLAVTALVESSRRTALVAEIDAILARETSEALPVDDDERVVPPYTIHDAAADLFAGVDWLEHQHVLLRRKKNIILQGPPGVGKTWVAKRLAYLLMGVRDDERVELVQFHPSYSYEQFVRGYRPNGSGGFAVANGPLVRLAERAKGDPDKPYVLVIDEINRGHLGKILGEAMMLLEADKRSPAWGVQLAYPGVDGVVDGERFWLPDNLYVIGTMNTADRSLAVVDYALRRRFAFVTLDPAFATPAFRAQVKHLPSALIDDVVARLTQVNELICADAGLGRGFQIGHSALCQQATGSTPEAWVRDILMHEVLPLLEEYWFDAPASLQKARQVLGLL